MTLHEEMLKRMDGANPLPDVEMITDGQLAELTLLIEDARRTGRVPARPQELVPSRIRVRWLRPVVAFGSALLLALAVIGVVSLVTGGEQDVADQPPTTSTLVTTTTVIPAAPEWNPILATTQARTAPAPATCAPGTDPNSPGSAGQARPAASGSLLAGAFDHRAGTIIFMDEAHVTWGFDVCTNTWSALQPSGVVTGNIDGGLVYDVDSDVTVSIEEDEVFVYDAKTNAWSRRTNHGDIWRGPIGATYDPLSGLIIAASPNSDLQDMDRWELNAYDVDSDEWHHLGIAAISRGTPCCTGVDLLGYSYELDRLILTTYLNGSETTLLLDPRTGEMDAIATPTPVVDLGWPSRNYGPADGTVFVQADDVVSNGRWTDVLCGFDPVDLTWSRCSTAPDEFPVLKHDAYGAIVGDPINNRLLLLHGVYRGGEIDDVWAIDLATGEWRELLAPSE